MTTLVQSYRDNSFLMLADQPYGGYSGPTGPYPLTALAMHHEIPGQHREMMYPVLVNQGHQQQQNRQQQHQQPPKVPHPRNEVAAASPHSHGAEGKARLRKACDSCSIRKVKVSRILPLPDNPGPRRGSPLVSRPYLAW